MDLAPIVCFVYNRPDHADQALKALAANSLARESKLFIFSDGAKQNDPGDTENVNQVRQIIRKEKWCKEVAIIESDQNSGLLNSIVNGVSEVIEQFGAVIVLEDDLVTSPWFLEFMNQGLETYERIPQIFSITGYMFPIDYSENKSVLLPYISTWGWATWKDRWQEFSETLNQPTRELNPHLKSRFNLGQIDYASMLKKEKNSWGIRWYYHVFQRNGLNVFPSQSLVKNIGFDESGTHSGRNDYAESMATHKINLIREEKMDLEFYGKYVEYLNVKNRARFWNFLGGNK